MAKSAIFLILAIIASVKSQEQCPGELSILPCICNIFDDRPSIECSQINDEEELERIFSTDFPEPEIQFFTLTNSYIPRLTRNVFGNVSFNDVYLRAEHLVQISADTFANSEETLLNWEVIDSPVTEDSFPFVYLDRYTRLSQLTLRRNQISQFPTVVSESLRFLFILENELLVTIPSDALTTVGNLTSLDLQSCGITTLENTAFRGTEQLLYLSLRDNYITTIRAQLFSYLPYLLEINLSSNDINEFGIGALTSMPALKEVNLENNLLSEIDDATFIYNPELENINLLRNEIDFIEPGTFDNLPKLQLIDLGYNNLSRLITDTFRGVNVTTLYVDYNVIDYIEVNAFGAVEESYVNLMANQLTNMYEYWLRPLLDNRNDVYLTGNPVGCGCEIGWLFEDPAYIDHCFARCDNATYLTGLNPDWYAENC